jgi:hypothetical protein
VYYYKHLTQNLKRLRKAVFEWLQHFGLDVLLGIEAKMYLVYI